MMSVYDAIDPDVGRELRKIKPRPTLSKEPSYVAKEIWLEQSTRSNHAGYPCDETL
jgi:hypothetical protein